LPAGGARGLAGCRGGCPSPHASGHGLRRQEQSAKDASGRNRQAGNGIIIMASCPSNEKLRNLLADALSAAEGHVVARHVEGCSSCQAELCRLTGIPDTERWRRAERPHRGSGAEEVMMRRLKQTT